MTEPAKGPDGKAYPERGTKKLISDLFTGADGKTWAYGRISALPVLLTGIGVPFYMVFKGMPLSLGELGADLAGTGAAVLALVKGTHSTDPPGPDKPGHG